MIKSLRFLSKFCGQIILVVAAFAAIVLAGVFLAPGSDNLFSMYLRVFPMLAVVIVALTMFTFAPYINLALSMNAGRPALFAALQGSILLLTAATLATLWGLWTLGGQLTGRSMGLGLEQAALFSSLTILLSEGAVLTTLLEGTLRKVIYGVSFVCYILFCAFAGGMAAGLEGEEASFLAQWFPPATVLAIAGGALALSAGLAVWCYGKMKKAVVRV